MLRRTIAPRTGAERTKQVDLGKKLEVITGPHRAGFHEVLARVAGKAGAHKDVQHIMYVRFCLGVGYTLMVCQCADQV